jgi:hypothetical protein
MDDLLPEELKEVRSYRLAPNAMERDLGLFTHGFSRSQITCDEVRRYTGMSLPELRARLLLAGGKLRYHNPAGDYGWFKAECVPSVAWWSEQYAIAEYLCLKDRGIVG